jgi:general secretion pathway protein I
MRAKVSGVGLLEALVALVLLATTGVALIQWLQQGTETLSRLERIEREQADREWALAMLQTRSLLEEPEGRLESGSLQVRWTTAKTTAPRPNATPGGVAGPWQVALVELRVELRRSGQPSQQFPLTLLAKRRISPVENQTPL